jgi:hypothetical protein
VSGRDPSEVSDVELESVAHELAAITHSSQWGRILAIGKLILGRFFGNDEQSWRARRRNKDQSIRRLALRPDCPLGKSGLTEAVGVYVLSCRHPELNGFRRITPTHVGRTLSLKPAMALSLLQLAEKHGWSVREVAFETKKLRRAMGDRRGRPVARSDRKAESSGKRALRALELMRIELGSVVSHDATVRERLASVCRALARELAATQLLLHPNLPVAVGGLTPGAIRTSPFLDPLSVAR